MYIAKVALFSEIRTNTLRKSSTMYSFWTVNLAVRKETSRLEKVKERPKYK